MRKPLAILAIVLVVVPGLAYWLPSSEQSRFDSRDLAGPPVPPPAVGATGGWRLIFADDFAGDSLNTERWTACFWWDNRGCTIAGNNELQWYQPENVTVGNDVLRLRVQKQVVAATDGNTYTYTSGMISSGRETREISTPVKFAFRYGYAKIRVKIPEGKGLWPAVWMLPVSHKSKPEIDVMEILGHEPNTVHMNLHYLKADGRRGREGKTWSGVDFSEGWHTFAVDWQPEAIIWYVDGVERWRYTDVSHIPQERMYLLANLALGGDWAGAPNKKTRFPSYFEVDYIRVWQRSEQTLCGGMLPREPY